MKILLSIISLLICSQIILAQDTVYIHRKEGGLVKELKSNIDSITFSEPKPAVLAQWDFPITNGKVNLNQTSGSLNLGAFTGFNAVLSADSGTNGVLATGNLWVVSDPGIGIILQFATPKDFSSATSVTFTVKVENPPVTSPGIMAYVQNGAKLNYAGDYSFWRPAPVNGFVTYTYPINKLATNLDIKTIVSFRIKANGSGDSGTNCGKAGGSCARVRITKVVIN